MYFINKKYLEKVLLKTKELPMNAKTLQPENIGYSSK